MQFNNHEWLSFEQAVVQFGYAHKNSLSARIRQLRKQEKVIDIGSPPKNYTVSEPDDTSGKIIIMWLNGRAPFIRVDTPGNLLNAKPGRR